jgi:hypothetical protein
VTELHIQRERSALPWQQRQSFGANTHSGFCILCHLRICKTRTDIKDDSLFFVYSTEIVANGTIYRMKSTLEDALCILQLIIALNLE